MKINSRTVCIIEVLEFAKIVKQISFKSIIFVRPRWLENAPLRKISNNAKLVSIYSGSKMNKMMLFLVLRCRSKIARSMTPMSTSLLFAKFVINTIT